MRPDGLELARLLREKIRQLSPGMVFPSVRELMKEHKVSQSIVSQALMALRQEGLVESQVGRGTFVAAKAPLRKVLWVCGIDLFHGDISPYYNHVLRHTRAALAQQGLSMEPVWLSNFRREDSGTYCTPDALNRHVGFIFCGCSPDHPVLLYVARSHVPFVVITSYECRSPNAVIFDTPRMLREGFSHLSSKGHRDVTLMTNSSSWLSGYVQAAASSAGVRVEYLECPICCWAEEQERQGYFCMRQAIASRGLPGALFIPDDITAKGATRAMLEQCDRREIADVAMVVFSVRECRPHLGVPVAWVMVDIEEQIGPAISMLGAQLDGSNMPSRDAVIVGHSLVTETQETPCPPEPDLASSGSGKYAFVF